MKHKVICINRRAGSAGHEIGRLVAKKLGIGFYDDNLVELAKEHGGISSDVLDDSDEKATSSLHYKLLYEGNENVVKERPATEMLFQLQSDVIRKIAEKEDCVFVGRCCDAVLEDQEVNSLSIFITAPLAFRVQYKMDTENLNKRQAASLVRKIDKNRANHYHYFVKREWDKPINYDIVLNSANFGLEGAAYLICELYKHAMPDK